jgi:hypothetical protein
MTDHCTTTRDKLWSFSSVLFLLMVLSRFWDARLDVVGLLIEVVEEIQESSTEQPLQLDLSCRTIHPLVSLFVESCEGINSLPPS